MNTKSFVLFCSTIDEEVIDHKIIDPLDTISCSEEFATTRKNKSEAIIEFQNTNIYRRFCETHRIVHTYIKENDDFFRRADSIAIIENDKDS